MAGHVVETGSNRVRANPLGRGGGRARGGTGPSVTSSLQLYVKVNFYKNKGNQRSAPIFRCSRHDNIPHPRTSTVSPVFHSVCFFSSYYYLYKARPLLHQVLRDAREQ